MPTILRPVAVVRAAALLALAACTPLSVLAQAAAPPPTPLAAPAPPPASLPLPAPVSTRLSDALLSIPMPAGATVQVEMDVHDDDLLGVYKSFLKGIGQAAQNLPLYSEPVRTTTSTTQTTTVSTQMATVLSNADLSDILKGTTHVHLLVLQVPGASRFTPTLTAKVLKGKPIKAAPSIPATPDQTAFYETAFGAEGGRRILFANIDPLHMTMVSFGHARGYAVMFQVPGTIAIMRADGYPDLSKLSALVTQVSAAAAKAALDAAAAHKKIGDSD